jgi:23S rRNA (adenine2503-C2)-methyltransferase
MAWPRIFPRIAPAHWLRPSLSGTAVLGYQAKVLALNAITPETLAAQAPAIRLDEARKIIAQVHRGEPVSAGSAIRRVAAEAARAIGYTPTLKQITRQASTVDPFVKFMLEAPDGARIETVRIPLEHPDRFSVCVSSQVGCAMACSFCATGKLGLSRNLTAWEIVEQVRIVRSELTMPKRVHGVVFQGMGEPLANLDAVINAINVFKEPSALGIDARGMTVCTSGLPTGIRRLAAEAPKVRMAWSVGSARSEVRRAIMPVAKAHSDAEVTTGLSPMWAVTLLSNINDFVQDATALANLTKQFAADTGVMPRLSIIPYNPIGHDDPYQRSSMTQQSQFRAVLADAGLASHLRYSGGGDVAAACGQLVAGNPPRKTLAIVR